MIQKLFPDLGVWNCGSSDRSPKIIQGGPAALQTALYLTTTSTSIEIDNGPASAQGQVENTRSLDAYTENEAPAETSTSLAHPIKLPSPMGSIVPSAPLLKPSPDLLGSPTLPANAPAQITINDQIVTPNPQSRYIVSGQTLLPGSSITLGSGASATVLSLHTSSGITALVYGPRTSVLTSPSITTPQPLTIGSETITPNAQSRYVISGQTLAPGSSITLGSGTSTTVLALHTSGGGNTAFIYGTSTSLLGTPNPGALTIGSDTITPNIKSQYIISGQTLSLGSSITLGSGASTTVLALHTSSDGSKAFIYGTSTSLLGTSNPAALTIGSETITPNARSQYIISGSTLTPGATITLGSGSSTTVLALETSGSQTALVYAPSTSLLTPTTALLPAIITIGSETITANSETQ